MRAKVIGELKENLYADPYLGTCSANNILQGNCMPY
jgi:hypothetical protein